MTSIPPVFTSRRDPDAEPIVFVLDVEHDVARPTEEGEPKVVREQRRHTFTCRAQLTAGTMLDLQGAGQRLGYDRFMEQALTPADRVRWADLIRDPDAYLGADDLDAAIQWLVEQYAARPTTRSARSPRGPLSTGSGSTDSLTSTSDNSPPTAD